MTNIQHSIPLWKRIHAAFAATLVTAAVICVFPLMEKLAAVRPAPTTRPAAVPVKLAAPPRPSISQQHPSKAIQPQKSTKLAAMALPKPLPPPPKTPAIQLPPKPLPTPTQTVDINLKPSAQPTATDLPPTPKMPAEIIPQNNEAENLEVSSANSADATTATKVSNTLFGTNNGGIPDGKSLKHPPVLLTQLAPDYPEYARRRGINGFVILQFIVDIKGRVVETSVQQANPQGYFETAAIRALKKCRFSPGRNEQGTPVPCRLQLRIDFILKDSQSYGQYLRLQ